MHSTLSIMTSTSEKCLFKRRWMTLRCENADAGMAPRPAPYPLKAVLAGSLSKQAARTLMATRNFTRSGKAHHNTILKHIVQQRNTTNDGSLSTQDRTDTTRDMRHRSGMPHRASTAYKAQEHTSQEPAPHIIKAPTCRLHFSYTKYTVVGSQPVYHKGLGAGVSPVNCICP